MDGSQNKNYGQWEEEKEGSTNWQDMNKATPHHL